MELLKKLWELCGDEAFTWKVICVFCTAVTIFYLLFMDLPPEVNALMAMLNGVMIILGLVEDD